MKKIYSRMFNVWLLHKRDKWVELLLCSKEGEAILIVNVDLDNAIVFSYITCREYCYGNRDYYSDHINKAIEVLKNEKR